MAVRDQEPLWRHLPWKDTLGTLPAVFVMAGLLIYAYLSTCYDRFYGSLGVDPHDVGLTYIGTLARSSGFVIASLFIIGCLVTAFLGVARGFGVGSVGFAPLSGRRLALVRVVFVGLLIGAFSSAPFLASNAARDVQAGKPVAPIQFAQGPWSPSRPPLIFPVVAIHADPATVEPAGDTTDSSSIERLQSHRLLYLGQSGGTTVLYDATSDRAVYVPTSSIVLHVADCDAMPSREPCAVTGS
jgi:hypothetical protein